MSDDAVQRNLAPPDEVCLHEAMLAGAQRLHDFGIKSYAHRTSFHCPPDSY